MPRGRPITVSDDALLDAARDVFLEAGVGATTAEIARRAEISESVLFYRFKSKEALFEAVLERQAKVPPVLRALRGRAGSGDLAQTLTEVGQSVADEIRSAMPLLMIASIMARAGAWKVEELRERMRRPHPSQRESLELLAGYLEAEAEAGRIRPVDAEIAARVFLGSVVQHVMSQHWLSVPDARPLSTPRFVRGLVDLLLAGLLPRRRERPR